MTVESMALKSNLFGDVVVMLNKYRRGIFGTLAAMSGFLFLSSRWLPFQYGGFEGIHYGVVFIFALLMLVRFDIDDLRDELKQQR